MLTRNNPSFVPDLSEQQLLWETNPDLGSTQGGGGGAAMTYCCTHGVVSEAECPAETNSAYWDSPAPGDPWPLASGWQNRAWVSTGDLTPFVTQTTDGIKAALKSQGPLLAGILASNDLYRSVADVENHSLYRQPVNAVDHAVVIVGYQDDPAVVTGGYWIIKNSWGTGEGQTGYDFIPYGNIENHLSTQAYSGPVYYTGAMASATWSGGAGTWAAGDSTKWSGYAWENKETAATFSGTGGAVTVSGSVIAHGMIVSSTGYSFTGGSLTVTAAGVTADQSVTFSSPVFIGAPQSWTIASGKTATISGPLHTIISDLTFAGAGNVAISGAIDGGGVLNSYGAKPGALIFANTGTKTLTGTSNFGGDVTVSSGTLSMNVAGGTYSGAVLRQRQVGHHVHRQYPDRRRSVQLQRADQYHGRHA